MEVKLITTRAELRAALVFPSEQKDLNATIDAAGGYTLAGDMLNDLVRFERRASAMRRLCRVVGEVVTDELAIPTATRVNDATWSTSESSTGTWDTAQPFGERLLYPNELLKKIKVSRTLLRKNPQAETFILQLLADAIAKVQERGMLRGAGVGEPAGLLMSTEVASYTTAAAGALTLVDIKRWALELGGAYHEGAAALMHPDTLSALAQLDTAGAVYDAGRLFGTFPIELSDEMPSGGTNPASLTSGAIIAAFGDFKQGYLIGDADQPRVQRLTEVYADVSQVGFHVRRSTDGNVLDPGAIRKLVVQ